MKAISAGSFVAGCCLAAAVNAAETAPRRIENQRGVFYLFAPPEGAAASEYIAARHKVLDQLFFGNPGNRFQAQISLSRHVGQTELVLFLRRHDFRLRTLNFGWEGQTGGHELAQGESLEEAFLNINAHYEGLLADLQQSRESRIRDGRIAVELDRRAANLRATLRSTGVRYFGVVVEGTVESLKFSREKEPLIRLVDVLWSEESDASGTSAVRKIAVPLPPDRK